MKKLRRRRENSHERLRNFHGTSSKRFSPNKYKSETTCYTAHYRHSDESRNLWRTFSSLVKWIRAEPFFRTTANKDAIEIDFGAIQIIILDDNACVCHIWYDHSNDFDDGMYAGYNQCCENGLCLWKLVFGVDRHRDLEGTAINMLRVAIFVI